MTKICAISDIHGNLNIQIDKSDILIIAGDICFGKEYIFPDEFGQKNWIKNEFSLWLDSQPATHKILISGNRDFKFNFCPHYEFKSLNCIYLNHSSTIINDLKIYGMPMTPNYRHLSSDEKYFEIINKINFIPEKIDILISHGPPFGILDRILEPPPP